MTFLLRHPDFSKFQFCLVSIRFLLLLPLSSPSETSTLPLSTMAELKTAPLLIIDFARLVRHDASEVNRLLEACQTHGFFYLNLEGVEAESQTILADWQSLLQTTKKYFNQAEEIKIRDDRNSGTYGYVCKECDSHNGTSRLRGPDISAWEC